MKPHVFGIVYRPAVLSYPDGMYFYYMSSPSQNTSPFIIITCEHGGNKIPPGLRCLFKGKEKILQSHRGWDPGALELAKKTAISINAPLFYEEISRLVIEQNRSPGSRLLFSEYLNDMNERDKRLLVKEIYEPFHKNVKKLIDSAIFRGMKVCHFSIHTFTPVLHGEIRNADLGFLYDPSRKIERETCLGLQSELLKEIKGIHIRRNYPYTGISDGHTTGLRKIYPENLYRGIEVEVNQKHCLTKSDMWYAIGEKLGESIKRVLENR